jgi:hypothetical protein
LFTAAGLDQTRFAPSTAKYTRPALFDIVEETLAHLASRHDLTLFTKGHPEDSS